MRLKERMMKRMRAETRTNVKRRESRQGAMKARRRHRRKRIMVLGLRGPMLQGPTWTSRMKQRPREHCEMQGCPPSRRERNMS